MPVCQSVWLWRALTTFVNREALSGAVCETGFLVQETCKLLFGVLLVQHFSYGNTTANQETNAYSKENN
jgi:hypothetical protein